jgi:HEAT repeat protein
MKKLGSWVLPLVLAIPLIWFGEDAQSCIRFKKPSGSVPPGLRDPADPVPPEGPDSPTTPSQPGPTSPTTPGPSMPTTPMTPPPATGPVGPATPNGGQKRGQAGPDTTTWEVWWELNRIDFFPHRWVAPVVSPDEGGLTPKGPQPLDHRVVKTKIWDHLTKLVDDKQVFVQEAALITMGRVAANEEQRAIARTVLTKKLRHRNHLIARAAALGMFYVADDTSILDMYKIAVDEDAPEDVRAFLALTMTNLKHPMAPQLLKQLADTKKGYYELVGAAIMGLGYVGLENDPGVADFLKDIAFGKKKVRAKYRALAVESFGRIGSLAVGSEPILKGLTDREADVRRSSATAAGVLDYRTEAERQIDAIKAPYEEYEGIPISPEDEIRIKTLEAQVRPQQQELAKGIKAIVHALGKAMKNDNDPFTRRMAAVSLGRIRAQTPHGELGVRYLKAAIKKDRIGMREFALLSLAIAGDEEALSIAKEFAKERNPSTRGAGVIALGLIGNKDRVHRRCTDEQREDADQTLRAILGKDKHPYIRGYACLALGILGNESSVGQIQATVQSTGTPETRAYGMLGLALLGTKRGADDVVNLIKTDAMRNGFVASHAVYALGLTKDRRSSTFDSLIERATDKGDQYVQAAALAAIGYLSTGEFYPRRHLMATGYNFLIGYDYIETYFYKL